MLIITVDKNVALVEYYERIQKRRENGVHEIDESGECIT